MAARCSLQTIALQQHLMSTVNTFVNLAHRTRRTASDERDSHPRRCAFPSGFHLRLHWLHISKLQFKAEGPNFNAELIPVHSPLLRESCLVSYPPLTYMLKFSGFADLTSCQGSGHGPRCAVSQVTLNQSYDLISTSSPKALQQ